MNKFSPEQIWDHWRKQALTHRQEIAASWSDRYAVELEIKEVLARLSDGDDVLDVGCANGFSTVRYAELKRVRVRGIDYIPEMIAEAKARAAREHDHLLGQVEFDVDNILSLRESSGRYDKVVAVRVLINLSDLARQVIALKECARVLRDGGLLLLSEATLQGWHRLNALRAEWGLAPIPTPAFNEYLDEERIVKAGSPELEIIEILNFTSTYFVGTRLLKPLLAKALNTAMDVANPEHEWNRWFAMLPAWGDYGTQKMFVFRKR